MQSLKNPGIAVLTYRKQQYHLNPPSVCFSKWFLPVSRWGVAHLWRRMVKFAQVLPSVFSHFLANQVCSQMLLPAPSGQSCCIHHLPIPFETVWTLLLYWTPSVMYWGLLQDAVNFAYAGIMVTGAQRSLQRSRENIPEAPHLLHVGTEGEASQAYFSETDFAFLIYDLVCTEPIGTGVEEVSERFVFHIYQLCNEKVATCQSPLFMKHLLKIIYIHIIFKNY